MEKNQIIKKVEVPTEWLSSIKKEYHVTPALEEILPKLVGAKVFTIIDTEQGYWNIKLDEQSILILHNVQQPLWSIQISVVSLGLKMSQEIFQWKMEVYEGLPGVI